MQIQIYETGLPVSTTSTTASSPIFKRRAQLTLSPSRCRTWIRCRKSYSWKYHFHLQRRLKESPLELGVMAAEIFEHYYKAKSEERSQSFLIDLTSSIIQKYKLEFLSKEPKPDRVKEWDKIVRTLAKTFSGYKSWADHHSQFPDSQLQILEVETDHTIQLTDKLDLLARPDAKILYNGQPVVFEHKLRYKYRTGDFGIDLQCIGSGLVTGSIGTLFNIVKYSEPSLHREMYIRDEYETNYFRQVFIDIGNDILNTPEERMYMQPMKRCSCSYWELCLAEISGLDIEDIVRNLFTNRTKDSPKENPKENLEIIEL